MDNINYNVKPNYNDLMNAYTRSLKVSVKHSLPPVPPVPVRPTMTITSTTVESGESTDDSQINLTFTSSEDTTDFISSDVQISGGTISNFTGSGKVYSAVFTPSGYATYTISVLANSFTDGSGNGNVASNEFKWTYTNTIQPFPSNYDNQWYLENIKFKDYFQNETQRQDLLSQLANSSVKIAINDVGVQQTDVNNPNNTEINDFNKLDKSLSKGFNSDGPDDRWWPLNSSDDHGTMCGSMAVSSGNKLYGTAPGLPFVSLRQDGSEDAISDSLLYENQKISVYSCSWGPNSGDTTISAWVELAIKEGSQNGRGGKGCVYVCAVGNSSVTGDTGVFNYMLNLAETLSVGATNIDDKRASYSETGANLLCVAPGGEQQFVNDPKGVLVFNNNYDLSYVDGTSFACPLVSGLCGVMLTLRNDLTWIDVKEIISKSCIKNDPQAGGSGADNTPWFNNQVGRPFNLQYGFGLIDYGTVISNTKNHVLLPEQNGFKLILSEDIDLSQPQEISFVIDDNAFTSQINDNIPLTENYDTFVIQEFVIVFGILEDGSDSNNEVHELSISLSVDGRGYSTDYTNQAITNGRKVSFETTTQLLGYPVLSEFLKGEKLVGDGNSST